MKNNHRSPAVISDAPTFGSTFSRRQFLQTAAGLGGAIFLSGLLGKATAQVSERPQKIVRCAIYPSIGVARVGNSKDDFFIGPEVPGEALDPPGGFKDAQGCIKRQAARFRIYGLNDAGEVVKEITADDGEIEWRIHLANRKAAWYEFNNAMDLGKYAMDAKFRNNETLGDERKTLIIDSGSRTISGHNYHGPNYQFDTGKFQEITVPLGELRTDDHGRLLVLGGYGHSASASNSPATTFANNDECMMMCRTARFALP